MRALLVYPTFPPSYWGFNYALPLSGKKAAMPPLGLVTVAAMCPPGWELRLTDLNIEPLRERDLRWAELVMVSGMMVQHESMMEVLARCKQLGVRTVVGGPHATSSPQLFEAADHLVLDEAETSFPRFLADLESGSLKREYSARDEKPDVAQSPLPRFDLLKLDAYSNMCVQYSRGCPFNCEFCDIIELYGRKPRTKTPQQVVAELEELRRLGWRAPIFMVDDNFIGNKHNVRLLLPAITAWQKQHGYPFGLYTEASMNLSVDDKLMAMMVEAGFNKVFVGIETPSVEALKETQKLQNTIGDPLDQIRKIQEAGLEVTGGFIIGFDSDDETIFETQKDFIRRANIAYAMVGILAALPNTQLSARMEKEGRLLGHSSGDQFGSTNFVTRIPAEKLAAGYRDVLATLYDPDNYFERVYQLIATLEKPEVPRPKKGPPPPLKEKLRAIMALVRLAYFSRYRKEVRRFFKRVRRDYPKRFGLAAARAIIGYHFFEYTRRDVLPRLVAGKLAQSGLLQPAEPRPEPLVRLRTGS
jgi:radical SAM superfamily enzyme YgiQ (UPF0313 family)